MTTTHHHTDLLLEGTLHHVPHRRVDVPKIEKEFGGNGSFNWKPTLLLVAILVGAVVAVSYL